MKLPKKGLLLLTLCASTLSYAQSRPQAGFSGELALNGVYLDVQSNLDTKAEATWQQGQTNQYSASALFPLGNLQYHFGSQANHQLFVGTSRADIAVGSLALEAGYQYQFANGMQWSLAILPTVLEGKVWQDPFKLSGARTETNESGTAYRTQIKKIAGSNLSLDLAYGSSKVEQENSGSELSADQALLARSGDVYYAKADYMIPLQRNLLLFPAFKYIQNQADGDAMKNRGVGGELTALLFLGRHQIAATLGYMQHQYQEQHPRFTATRSDQRYKSFIAYEYTQLMQVERLSLVAFAGYDTTASNLDFYDQRQLMTSVGVNWRF